MAIWLCSESANMLHKYFYEERTRWVSHRYKNSQSFSFFIHLSTEEKRGPVVDTVKWSQALPVNIASKYGDCAEQLKSNMNVNICLHTLHISRTL